MIQRYTSKCHTFTMNFNLIILLMSLVLTSLLMLQHQAAAEEPPDSIMLAQKRTDEEATAAVAAGGGRGEGGESQVDTSKTDILSIGERQRKPTLQLFQLDENDFYRHAMNNSLLDIINGFNLSNGNDTYGFEEEYAGCSSVETQQHLSVMKLITMILYAAVCIVGLFGNTLVIYVVLRFSKMQTVTNIYILNLAIADECFLIGIPFLLFTMNNGWQFGEYACKAYYVSTSITQFTSSIFLLIMSADRYIAVCHPIASPRYRTPTVSKLVSGIAWLTSALLMLPVLLFANTVTMGERTSCNIEWPEDQNTQSGTTFILYSLALGFATPLTFILAFYCLVIRKLHTVGPKHKSKEKKRSHRKVTKLVLTVITVYILCWLPYWISQVANINSTPGKCKSNLEVTIFLLTSCLSYTNSAMNPILYAFLSDNFKKSFMKACTCAARKDVNAQLQLENSMFPRFNKSRPTEKLLAPNKSKQRSSLLCKNSKQKSMIGSSTATTTTGTSTCATQMTFTDSTQNNHHLAPPAQQNAAASCGSNNSNMLMLPANSICTENSNIDNTSLCSEEFLSKPPVLHTDL